jgi:hypothetical protein
MLTDVVISAKSANSKVGPMPTISRPIEKTCPSTCPFLPKSLGGNGKCYANGRINGTVRKLASDMTLDAAEDKIRAGMKRDGKYLRDRVVGDVALPDGGVDVDYLLDVAELGRRLGLTAYGYTHAYADFTPEQLLAVADSGYVLNASCNTSEDIERAVALGMPTTYAGDDLEDGDVIAGRRIVTCPEQTGRVASCAECGLCAKPNRAATVRFLIH